MESHIVAAQVFSMDEIEVKVFLGKDGLLGLRRKLAKGGKKTGKVAEKNFILDTKDNALRARGCLLRVRFEGKRCLVTYKAPKAGGKYKSREETQTQVSDGEEILKVFGALGLRKVWRYDKMRESYRFGKAVVDVDTLPLLGTVVEVEATSEKAVTASLKALGLQGSPKSNGSYADLARQYFKSRGEKMRDLVFAGKNRRA